MVRAEPDEPMIVRIRGVPLRAALPDDAEHGAQLLAADRLAGNHVPAAGDVVVGDVDAAAVQHHPVGISALVDRGIGESVVCLRGAELVPFIFAIALSEYPT